MLVLNKFSPKVANQINEEMRKNKEKRLKIIKDKEEAERILKEKLKKEEEEERKRKETLKKMPEEKKSCCPCLLF